MSSPAADPGDPGDPQREPEFSCCTGWSDSSPNDRIEGVGVAVATVAIFVLLALQISSERVRARRAAAGAGGRRASIAGGKKAPQSGMDGRVPRVVRRALVGTNMMQAVRLIRLLSRGDTSELVRSMAVDYVTVLILSLFLYLGYQVARAAFATKSLQPPRWATLVFLISGGFTWFVVLAITVVREREDREWYQSIIFFYMVALELVWLLCMWALLRRMTTVFAEVDKILARSRSVKTSAADGRARAVSEWNRYASQPTPAFGRGGGGGVGDSPGNSSPRGRDGGGDVEEFFPDEVMNMVIEEAMEEEEMAAPPAAGAAVEAAAAAAPAAAAPAREGEASESLPPGEPSQTHDDAFFRHDTRYFDEDEEDDEDEDEDGDQGEDKGQDGEAPVRAETPSERDHDAISQHQLQQFFHRRGPSSTVVPGAQSSSSRRRKNRQRGGDGGSSGGGGGGGGDDDASSVASGDSRRSYRSHRSRRARAPLARSSSSDAAGGPRAEARGRAGTVATMQGGQTPASLRYKPSYRTPATIRRVGSRLDDDASSVASSNSGVSRRSGRSGAGSVSGDLDGKKEPDRLSRLRKFMRLASGLGVITLPLQLLSGLQLLAEQDEPFAPDRTEWSPTSAAFLVLQYMLIGVLMNFTWGTLDVCGSGPSSRARKEAAAAGRPRGRTEIAAPTRTRSGALSSGGDGGGPPMARIQAGRGAAAGRARAAAHHSMTITPTEPDSDEKMIKRRLPMSNLAIVAMYYNHVDMTDMLIDPPTPGLSVVESAYNSEDEEEAGFETLVSTTDV